MKHKTVLITGSTDGIGKQTALDLAGLGYRIIVHGRNPEVTKLTAIEIASRTGNINVDFYVADFSSLLNVKRMSDEIHAKYNHLDILINNAGVYLNEKILSQDGFEMTFAVNHLSHYLLTYLLIDLLQNAKQGRILNVASMAHASELDFENLLGEKYFDAYTAYSYSKLCNILFTYRLAEKYLGDSLTANCLHPGVISTKLLHAGWGSEGSRIDEGSKTSIYLATSPGVELVSGKYYSNGKSAKSAKISYNRDIQKQLWTLSEKMTEVKFK